MPIKITKKEEEEKMCTCGDSENMHIDNMEQCFIPECGCKEFEEVDRVLEAENKQ